MFVPRPGPVPLALVQAVVPALADGSAAGARSGSYRLHGAAGTSVATSYR